MSGFVCILNLDGAPVEPSLLERMTAHMQFRGPHALAHRIEGNVGLGHALLRTTVESAHEQQPLAFDANAILVSDARLDARQELIEELETRGRRVQTGAPDAELLLHAYLLWGEACVDHLAGDFAFTVWNTRQNRLFCARDQLGIKPLFYASIAGALVVSNTLSALRLHPGVTNRLNEQAIGDFLLFGMNQEFDTTTFADVSRLPPAHVLVAEDRKVTTRRYWSLHEPARDFTVRPDAAYIEPFRELLERAVADRLRTTRVGAHLSGGMDSSSVVLLTLRALQKTGQPFELRTFTTGFTDIIPDREADLARTVAGAAGLPLEQLSGESFLGVERLPEPGFVSPEPFSIPALDSFAEINRRVAAFGGTLITGFGGDPLLFPSRTFLRDCFRRGETRALFHAIASNRRLNGGLPPLYLKSTLLRARKAIPPAPSRHWLNPSFAARLNLDARWRDGMSRIRTQSPWQLFTGTAFWSNLFAAWDSTYTGLPLDVRFPFCDLRLVDLVSRVPAVPWLEKKRLLRAAMCDILPQQILERPKTPLAGFPFSGWVSRHGAPGWMYELMESPWLAEYADPARLREMAGAPHDYPPGDYDRILLPLTLAYWQRATM